MKINFSKMGSFFNVEFISKRNYPFIMCSLSKTSSKIALQNAPSIPSLIESKGYECYIALLKEIGKYHHTINITSLLKNTGNASIKKVDECSTFIDFLKFDEDEAGRIADALYQDLINATSDADILKRFKTTIKSYKFWRTSIISDDLYFDIAFTILTHNIMAQISIEELLKAIVNIGFNGDFKTMYKHLKSRVIATLAMQTELIEVDLHTILP